MSERRKNTVDEQREECGIIWWKNEGKSVGLPGG
jgi:hypothetical protein